MRLLRALSRKKKRIDEASLNWAWDYVIFYTKEMLENVEQMMGMTSTARIAEHLAEAIYEVGRKGLNVGDMGRKSHQFKKLDKRQSEEVLYMLTTHHDIVLAKVGGVGSGKRGKPTMKYIHNDFL